MSAMKIDVYSKKHNTSGIIISGQFDAKLLFRLRDKRYTISMHYYLNEEMSLEKRGELLLESVLENLIVEESETRLYNWHISEEERKRGKIRLLNGNITGHHGFTDSTYIISSPLTRWRIDFEREELIAESENTVFHCPLVYLNFFKFEKQCQEPDKVIPNYWEIKERYEGQLPKPEIEAGNVLLTISNFDKHYFHSVFCRPVSGYPAIEFQAYPHIQTFQDSVIIKGEGEKPINLRYWPHFQNIQFYIMDTGELPLYVENVGTVPMYAKTFWGQVRLEPEERKQICEENYETPPVLLPDGDLYPIDSSAILLE